MLNVVILMAGPDRLNRERDGEFPVALIEFQGKPVIERLVDACAAIPDVHLTFVAREHDIKKFRLDNVFTLLSPGSRLVSIERQTKGAACSALLAATQLPQDQPLLVLSIDEVLELDFAQVIAHFQAQGWDGGLVSFPSVHPRYSFVRLDAQGLVVEAAEKNPISRHATAGFYYFATAAHFVQSAQNMIRKDAHVNGVFYVCPAYNELVLKQARIGIWPLDKARYHPIKSDRQIAVYEHQVELGVQQP